MNILVGALEISSLIVLGKAAVLYIPREARSFVNIYADDKTFYGGDDSEDAV